MEQTSRMLKRVPDPQNPGQLVEATPVRVISGELDAKLEVQLEDGAKIRFTLSIVEISRIDSRKDATGKPLYNFDTQGTINIEHPRERIQ